MRTKLLWALLLCSIPCCAQSTSVSATVTDTDGNVWANGTYQISFAPGSGSPAGSVWSGGNLSQYFLVTGALDSTGSFTVSLPSNTAINPLGSGWQFTICPNATSGCASTTIPVFGATMSLTTQLSAAARGPRFQAGASAYGYATVEVSPTPKPGALFYNTTPSASVPCNQWTGSAWQACAAGSTISLTTTGTGGAATLGGGVLNIPVYQTALGFTPTNAAVVPSTVPSAAQILVGNLGGTAYTPQNVSGDISILPTGAVTVLRVNNAAVPNATVLGSNVSGQLVSQANYFLSQGSMTCTGTPVIGQVPTATASNLCTWQTATAHVAASALLCADTSGSGTAQTCTTSPSYTPAAGDWIIYTTTTANSGTGLTLNVNGLGAKSVAKWQGTTTLAANDVLANKYVLATYDGTNWELSTIGNAPGGTSGSYTILESHTVSGAASQNFTTWYSTTYDNYIMEFIGITPSTTGETMTLTMGNGSCLTAADYWYSMWVWSVSGQISPSGANAQTSMLIYPYIGRTMATANNSFGATTPMQGWIKVHDPGSTTSDKGFEGDFYGGDNLTAGAFQRVMFQGSFEPATAINQICVASTGGNFSGTIRIYGISH